VSLSPYFAVECLCVPLAKSHARLALCVVMDREEEIAAVELEGGDRARDGVKGPKGRNGGGGGGRGYRLLLLIVLVLATHHKGPLVAVGLTTGLEPVHEECVKEFDLNLRQATVCIGTHVLTRGDDGTKCASAFRRIAQQDEGLECFGQHIVGKVVHGDQKKKEEGQATESRMRPNTKKKGLEDEKFGRKDAWI
jgi:hypothetical protein